MPILRSLVEHGVPFVVVGSTARQLLDGTGRPNDLDIVVDHTADAQRRTVAALADVGGTIRGLAGTHCIEEVRRLPDWSWPVTTIFGCVDVVWIFVDGTMHADFAAVATPAEVGGVTVGCVPTSHSAR